MFKKLSSVMLFFVFFTILSPLAFSANPTMTYPVDSFVLTSPYGWRVHPITGKQKFHSGVDLGGDYGDTVRAALGGIVTDACWISGYGYTVIIDHGNGYSTLYGHNQGFLVSEGQTVSQGQPIALEGSTGNSTGPHCHFEVRLNGNVVNPGDYIPGLNALQIGQFGQNLAWGTDFDDKPKVLEVSEDFAKPLRDFAKQIGEIFEKAISLIKDFVWQIFIALAIIDFAISASYKALDDNNEESFTSWFLYKLIFLGILIYFFTNWGEFIGGVALNGFPALGSMVVNSSLTDAGKILSDPTHIVQKGLSLIAPIINEAMKLDAPFSITDFIISLFDPREQIIQDVCLIFGTLLFVGFFAIGIQLLLAYVYFYASILFAFTGFMFSGLKQTRKFASNGINGIFASSLTLMFFCMFAVMLQFTMEKIIPQDFLSTQYKTEEVGATKQIKSFEELLVRIKIVESYGGKYDVYNEGGSGAYGAYQFMPEYWDGRCENYIRDGGTLCTECSNNPPNAPKTKYPWCPENQDKIFQYQMEGFYNKYKDWNKVAMCHYGEGSIGTKEGEDYLNLVLNAKGKSEWESRTLAIEVLVQLTLLVLLFILMGDRIMKMINRYFGGIGFKLTNEG